MILKLSFSFLLLLISVTVNNYFGSIGVYPIDSFAFFDSANLINQGLIPFKDYWVINGVMIDLIQSIFFKYLGVSWKTYLFHSSLVNFIFTLVIFSFFLNIGLNIFLSFFYSLLCSIISYSIIGAPFPDQHSVFFSLIGFYFLFLSINKKKLIFWFLLPIPFFIAFLSKQVPAAYYIILVFFIFSYYFFKTKNLKAVFLLFLGVSTLLILTFLYLIKNEILINNFIIQYILFPQSIGESRYSSLEVNQIILKFINDFKFITFSLIILIYLLLKKNNWEQKNNNLSKKNYFVFFAVVIILIMHQILTKNQNFIFFIIPIILGLSHYELIKNKLYNQKNLLIISFFLIFISIFTTSKYHLRFNVERKFIELSKVELKNFKNAQIISKKLSGLKWINSNFQNNPDKEFQQIILSINFLKKVKNPIIILTDYQFLLAEIGHKLYSPNRWYTDDGVSYPLKENKFFNEYKNFYKSNLIQYKIEKIYTIEPLSIKSFQFIFDKDCIKTSKINEILFEHDIQECF